MATFGSCGTLKSVEPRRTAPSSASPSAAARLRGPGDPGCANPRKASGTGEVIYEEWVSGAWVPRYFDDWWASMTLLGLDDFNPSGGIDNNRGINNDWTDAQAEAFFFEINDLVNRIIDYRIYKGIVEPMREYFPLFRYASEYGLPTANASPPTSRWLRGGPGLARDSVALAKSRAGVSSPPLYRPVNNSYYKSVPTNTWPEATIAWTQQSIDNINAAPSDTPVHCWLTEPRENQPYAGTDYVFEFCSLQQQVERILTRSDTGPYPKTWAEFSVYFGKALQNGQLRRSSLLEPVADQSSDIAALTWLKSVVAFAGIKRGQRPPRPIQLSRQGVRI